MELKDQLANLKKKVMKKVAEAAGAHDTKRVTLYSGIANRIEDDEQVVAAVQERINVYEKEIAQPANTPSASKILDEITSAKSRKGTSHSITGKEEGSMARKVFLDAGKERGYQLNPRGKTVFETGKGHRVAIPFANEQNPNRWFLGISDEIYDAVVLLCQEKEGSLFDFVIPRVFLEKFWEAFSRSRGQVKLNVARSGNDWGLVIPDFETQAIGSFLAAYGPLRS